AALTATCCARRALPPGAMPTPTTGTDSAMDEAHPQTIELPEQPVAPPAIEPQRALRSASAARKEGVEKVTGRACYASDVHLPGMLWVKMLRSPYAHARIRRIDERKALALPGVRAVMSLNNAPQIPWYDRGMLFERIARFAGEEVAAVAAESERIAEDALRLTEVAHEPPPSVRALAEARLPGAPAVHHAGTRAGG